MDTLAAILKKGRVGVLPTDTLYGIVASAFLPAAVERIYALRKRDADKPLIVLISSVDELSLFGITLDDSLHKEVGKFWPGPVSIILPVTDEKFQYLHRGKKTLAFRFPRNEKLVSLLQKSGPLVAPSANIQGEPPATTIEEARNYFGEAVDFYEDGGTLAGEPSALITFEAGKVKVLRENKEVQFSK